MLMRHRLCATVILGGLLHVPSLPARATTAADLCPAGTGPCVVSKSIQVADGSIIDAGNRHLLIASGGVLAVDSGMMTLMADRLTVESGGALRGLGSGTAAGGIIVATANVIAVVGRVETAGAPGGEVTLTSAGDLTVTGTIDVSSRSRDEDGGSIDLLASTVTLAGPVLANGGRDGTGGDVTVTSRADLLISRNVESSGGDGGTIDLVAGDDGGGNLTISQNGRIQADALAEEGLGDTASLEANGDGLASGHILMNGLITVSGIADGNGGDIMIDADGDVRGEDPTAHILATGGRPNGSGGAVSVTTTTGQYTCAAMIDVRGNSAAPGGTVTFGVGGGITLATPIDARGGTIGGSIIARSSADISVDTALRSDSGMEGGALIELEGCTVLIDPTAVLSSLGPQGVNRLIGHDLTVVRGTMEANEDSGTNEVVYGEPRRRPVIFDSAEVNPAPVLTQNMRLAPCGDIATSTPTRTPTSTRAPRTNTPTMTPVACVGDCDGDGKVIVNELVLGVNIALQRQSLSECRAFDASGNGAVSVDELIRGVNGALHGCN